MTNNIPTVSLAAVKRTVLVIDDDEDILRATEKVLERFGWRVITATDVASGSAKLQSESADVVLCDINLPRSSGMEILSFVRASDIPAGVVLFTGNPSVATAIEAVELGASEYLTKPVDAELLNAAIERAWRSREQIRVGRASVRSRVPADVAALDRAFDRALAGMHMAFQPIYDLKKRAVVAYEALMRSNEPTMKSPLDVLDAASRLQRHEELGRRVRELVGRTMPTAPADVDIFVNLHSSDLLDPELFSPEALLARSSARIVFEVTERASMEGIADLKARVRTLRDIGYRIAIDDLGAGYAGLTSFALLEPQIVKLDMSLVRDVNLDPMKKHLIEAMVRLCHGLDMRIVAEGIETDAELDAISELGCDLGQGYGLGRPGVGFVAPTFPQSHR
ncbi:hypothetical protein BH09MYX1_BH09MYX1_11140 [soil metagenome]